ncbi:hypothetical protein FKM82_016784 [Ascaphus truei]
MGLRPQSLTGGDKIIQNRSGEPPSWLSVAPFQNHRAPPSQPTPASSVTLYPSLRHQPSLSRHCSDLYPLLYLTTRLEAPEPPSSVTARPGAPSFLPLDLFH